MKKRFIALLLCCVMLLTLSPSLIASVAADDDANGTTVETPAEPKAEDSTVEEPKIEEPKIEEPKIEGPKIEEPKVEEPKAEEPKIEEPKAEDETTIPAAEQSDAPVESEIIAPTVNFTNVAPFLAPVTGVPQRRAMAKTFSATPRANDTATDNGMVINKTATANGDGSYTITLEAYATGEKVITEQKTDIPTDIILVLDQSGSMDYCIVCGKEMDGYNDYHDTYVATTSVDTNNTYYIKNGNKYTDVQYCSGTHGYFWGCEGGAGWYTSEWSSNHTAANKITPKTSDNQEGTQFYEYKREACSSRLQALKNAVTSFTNAVAEKAAGKDGEIATTEDNINHRIAVVGFASSGNRGEYNQNKYENTEVFVGATQYTYGTSAQSQYGNALQSMDTAAGKNNITSSIGALDAYGGTFTNLGMEMANGIFENNPIPDGQNRNRVIIVFTDGYPGTGTTVNSTVATNAVSQGYTAKQSTANGGYGATVYTVGIFSGADGTPVESFNGVSNPNKFMHLLSSNYKNAQSYSDSSEYGTATYPAGGGSYYLSAADADSLNSIFEQISDQIETGGSSSTLTAASVVKDIISPQFTLPAGATADGITLETYKYQGPSFAADNAWVNNNDAMGAKATVNGDTVSVTGFDFAANYVGTVTENGNVSYRGNKLVISFKVQPKAGFLGGNDVYTNFSAGVYENGSATDPVLSFPQPQVNVPIDDVAVTAANKNVYLLGEVTADQLKDGTEISVGDVTLNLAADATNYGLEEWQTAYVNITVEVKDKGGNVITTDLTDLTDDTTYTVEVTVAPKTQGTSTPEKGEAATAKTGVNAPAANIYVFNPEVNFKDSTIYRGNTADYSNNQTDTPVWKHGNKVDTAVDMIGTAPTLTYTYGKDEGAFENCTDVNVTVKIGSTDVTDKTTGDKQFTVHVLQPTVTATVNDVQKYYGESYTLGTDANGEINVTWTDKRTDHSNIPAASGTKPYEARDLTLAYSTEAFNGQDGIVPNSDFAVTVKVMKGDTEMPDATITTSCTLNKDCKTPDNDGVYTVHVKTCTITVKKSGCSDLDYHAANNTGNAEYQSFIFEVNGDEDNNVQIAPIKVTVQGNGEVKIVGLPTGTYTVTENQGWSWRYEAQNNGVATADLNTNHAAAVTITNTRTNPYWLSGDNYAVNHVGGIKAQGTFVGSN